MMAVHELGHVVGAILSGGTVERVVLHPLTISRTDVSPNPNPLVVVWLGPIVGCVLPLLAAMLVPRRLEFEKQTMMFFAGFCLLANGCYIALGSLDRVGDCGEMLQHGSPLWSLILFGVTAIAAGLLLWHRIGSVKNFLADPSLVNRSVATTLLVSLGIVLAIEFIFSPL